MSVETEKSVETARECDEIMDNLISVFPRENDLNYNKIFSSVKAVYNFIDSTTEKFSYDEKER